MKQESLACTLYAVIHKLTSLVQVQHATASYLATGCVYACISYKSITIQESIIGRSVFYSD